MAANIEDKLVERVRTLPTAQQERVLEFVEELEQQQTNTEEPAKRQFTTLWDKVRDIIEEIPAEAWEELPKDGSINVDHYLYGHPKKEE